MLARHANRKNYKPNPTMKFAVLFALTILSFGQTLAVANAGIKRTHVRFMQASDTIKTLPTEKDPVNALRPPVGPTDGDYGNAPGW